jgi:hypothetical protein
MIAETNIDLIAAQTRNETTVHPEMSVCLFSANVQYLSHALYISNPKTITERLQKLTTDVLICNMPASEITFLNYLLSMVHNH